jgi:D-lactate dehydrogenase
MKVAVFSTKPYDREFLTSANREGDVALTFLEPRLTAETAPLAQRYPAVCVFVNDRLDRHALESLHAGGTRLIALRCAGFNNVDLDTAKALGFTLLRVPAYSPNAVAEHAVSMMLALNRKIYRAYNRVREGNFALEGLVGFDMFGKTVGIIGTGRIGLCTARILAGFGCRILAYDVFPNDECPSLGAEYTDLATLCAESDIISLHCPLTPETCHLVDDRRIQLMKPGVMLINTGRGALIDTQAVIDGLKSRRIGYLGLDVYEEEGSLFFEDLSNTIIQDDVFTRLLTFPNVLITSHQGFFTQTAMQNIADVTIGNIRAFAQERLAEVRANLVPLPG